MKTLIVAAGKMPSKKLLAERAEHSNFIIAVDGGILAFKKTDIIPNLIVGDMDSATAVLVQRYIRVGSENRRAAAEKNETDTQLALDLAIRKGAKEILLLGATGGRIDHTLSNIMLLKRALRAGVSMRIEDKTQVIEIGQGEFDILGTPGQTVSILPVNSFARVTASGLYYPLKKLGLSNEKPRGVSNIFLRGKAHISTRQPVFIIKIKE
jgi:thiamine pyrophosphokinase